MSLRTSAKQVDFNTCFINLSKGTTHIGKKIYIVPTCFKIVTQCTTNYYLTHVLYTQFYRYYTSGNYIYCTVDFDLVLYSITSMEVIVTS